MFRSSPGPPRGVWRLGEARDARRIEAFVRRHPHASLPAHALVARASLGRSILVWTPGPSSHLLAVALVARAHRTATLFHLATTRTGPSLCELAAWVPVWNQPTDGIRVLRATHDVPRRALDGRWHPSRAGHRYHFRPGDQPAPCALCGAPRVSRREGGQYPGLVCPACDTRAVDRHGAPPPVLDDHVTSVVFIDGVRCARYHLFGGWITTRFPSHGGGCRATTPRAAAAGRSRRPS